MTLTTVTVNGTYKKADNTAADGVVIFKLASPIMQFDSNAIISQVPKVVFLDGSGTFTTTLLSSSAIGQEPGSTVYHVQEIIDDAIPRINEYDFVLQATGPVDLADVEPISSSHPDILTSPMQIITHKAADETVNNTTTLQNDNHLFFPIGIQENWQFDIVLLWAAANETADAKIGITVPSGAGGFWGATSALDTAATTALAGDFHNHRGFAETLAVGVDGTDETMTVLHGFVDNGGTAGNVQLQWAQNVLTAADLTLVTYSYLIARRQL